MTLTRLGTPRADGGCTFVAVGDPGVAVYWELVGPGVLQALSTVTNAAGVASARWASEGLAIAGDAIAVTVRAYA